MRLFILTLVFYSVSCGSIKNTITTIKLRYNEGPTEYFIQMDIPGKFNLIKIGTGGEGKEYQYWYTDSSMIYISDADGISTVNDSIVRIKKNRNYTQNRNDSIFVTGLAANGKYWLEREFKGLRYGYFNVSSNKKQLYDNAVKSLDYRH